MSTNKKSPTDIIEVVTDYEAPAASPNIENMIYNFRGVQVMIDHDLAMLYDVKTKVLNQAVNRNIERFPERFRFQLSQDETDELVTNCDRLRNLKHSSILPHVFTEQGVAMLSSVLNSPTAIKVGIQIMDAFVALRHFVLANAEIFQRLEVIEHHQLELASHIADTDHRLDEVFKRLDDGSVRPIQGIFFDGQIFDAYTFVSNLVRSAKSRIILFDNYVDDTVLTLLDKRADGVSAQIYTRSISPQLSLDLQRHNAQYRPIAVDAFPNAHDRFLCLDDTVHHIGASLKDLGKKWFAFSRMEIGAGALREKM
jgi:hypothetical protein